MLFKKSPEKFWNLIASKYAASPITDRPAYETKINKLKAHLSPDDIVLDIGCGTGTQCGDLASNVKQIVGIDISSKLLKIAEQRMADRKLTNVKFIHTSLFDARFLPESFDVVMAFYVLHFFEDIEAAIKQIHSLLKPGGIFISETACLGEQNNISGRMTRIAGQLGFLPLINLLTTAQLEQALNRTGFSIIDKHIFSESIHEYTLISRK